MTDKLCVFAWFTHTHGEYTLITNDCMHLVRFVYFLFNFSVAKSVQSDKITIFIRCLNLLHDTFYQSHSCTFDQILEKNSTESPIVHAYSIAPAIALSEKRAHRRRKTLDCWPELISFIIMIITFCSSLNVFCILHFGYRWYRLRHI